MKSKYFSITVVLVCALLTISGNSLAVSTSQNKPKSKREQKIEESRERMSKMMKACSYRFVPSSMTQEPAGSRIPLEGSLSELFVTGTEIIINIPYIAGIVDSEPVIFNCTGPISDDYTAIKSDPDNWVVTFSTSDVGPEVYQLRLEINSRSNSARLEIKCNEYPTVSYQGFVSEY